MSYPRIAERVTLVRGQQAIPTTTPKPHSTERDSRSEMSPPTHQ